MDSSGDSEEEEETEEREDAVQPNQRCVDTLTDTLHSMTLQSTVCHPERPSKVHVHVYTLTPASPRPSLQCKCLPPQGKMSGLKT